MKHIEKRFLFQSQSDSLKDKFKDSSLELVDINEEFDKKILSANKDSFAYLQTENGYIIGGFVHKINGNNFIFPVPDPTLIYFNNAQHNLRFIKENRKKLMEKLDLTKPLKETAISEIFSFYGVTTGFVIFLFTALESFINQMIPDDFKWENAMNKRTEIYNKQQIQEYIDFKTKATVILKDATKKDFFKSSSASAQYIWNLKEFRDDIIHTKQESDDPIRYKKWITKSLNFNYDNVIKSVANFMNFYKDNYIVECKCGADY